VGADRFEKYTLNVEIGPPVEYYISKTDHPAPLLLYIQGSGCDPVFLQMSPGVYASTIFSLTTTAHKGQFSVMVVEKPYAPAKRSGGNGAATGCPVDFNDYFSFDSWLRQVQIAYRDALQRPWVDKRRSLVIGISEGATIASGLAASDSSVSGVGLVGGTGPTQLFDMIVRAYKRAPDDASALEAINAVDDRVAKIEASPDSTKDFAWGHTYKRWSSFFRASSVEFLKRSHANVYLVSGMADENVPILSTEVAFSELRANGRDVVFRRIPTATHNLLPAGADFAASFPQMEAEYARITDWFFSQNHSPAPVR
jgi:hypothetical protein